MSPQFFSPTIVHPLNQTTGQLLFFGDIYFDEITGFFRLLFTVPISLNSVIFRTFLQVNMCNCLYHFHNSLCVTRAILDIYRKNFFAQFLFFCKFSLDQFYSISHVQFIYIVYHNVYPSHVLFFKILLLVILLKQCYSLVNLVILDEFYIFTCISTVFITMFIRHTRNLLGFSS